MGRRCNYKCNYRNELQMYLHAGILKVQCKNMYVHNKCTVINGLFKCKYLAVKVT